MVRAAFLVNPAAGGGRSGRLAASLLPRDAVIRRTAAPAHARKIARELLATGYNLIVVVGGDGTVNEVLNGLHDSPRRLREAARIALVPVGTGCDLARSLGYGDADPRRLLLGLSRTRSRRMDYGTASVRAGGRTEQRCFLNVASCGFSAQAAANVGRLGRRLNGTAAFFAAAMKTLAELRSPRARVEVDGRLFYEGRMLLAAVANGRYFGGSMMIAPTADHSSGALELILITSLDRVGVIRHIGKIYSGRHMGLPQVRSATARCVRVASLARTSVPVETDGELAGALDATFSVVPGGVTLALPDR